MYDVVEQCITLQFYYENVLPVSYYNRCLIQQRWNQKQSFTSQTLLGLFPYLRMTLTQASTAQT
jgi:hypothetical protein